MKRGLLFASKARKAIDVLHRRERPIYVIRVMCVECTGIDDGGCFGGEFGWGTAEESAYDVNHDRIGDLVSENEAAAFVDEQLARKVADDLEVSNIWMEHWIAEVVAYGSTPADSVNHISSLTRLQALRPGEEIFLDRAKDLFQLVREHPDKFTVREEGAAVPWQAICDAAEIIRHAGLVPTIKADATVEEDGNFSILPIYLHTELDQIPADVWEPVAELFTTTQRPRSYLGKGRDCWVVTA